MNFWAHRLPKKLFFDYVKVGGIAFLLTILNVFNDLAQVTDYFCPLTVFS